MLQPLLLLHTIGGHVAWFKLLFASCRSHVEIVVWLESYSFRGYWTINLEIQCVNDLDGPALKSSLVWRKFFVR